MSDDGRHALTLIAFIGSVFSPYYAWSRRRGAGDPLNHCALNVALYSPRGSRWSMTERGAARVVTKPREFQIGSSSLRWSDQCLQIDIDEICAPLPRRVRGSVVLFPEYLSPRSFALDAAGDHQWLPYAPHARIQVHLNHPELRWQGSGYCDSNYGIGPLEDAFESWQWSRSMDPQRRLMVYDVKPRSRPPRALAMTVDAQGRWEQMEPPPIAPLKSSGWRVRRATREHGPQRTRILKTLEDAPFYCRSLLGTQNLSGATAMHESLDLDRFRRAWVQCLLPFRMPRIS